MFLMAVVVARLVGGQWPALDRFGASTEYPALPIVTYWLANLVCYGFGEESAGEVTANRPWNSDGRCWERPPSSV
jgi:hypothetical protein